MSSDPKSIVERFLANSTNIDVVKEVVSPDASYVSLNFENPELKKIMPWTGGGKGPESFVRTFEAVGRYWKNERFEISEIFSSGENVAVFGVFQYKSNTAGKRTTSPFAILAKVKDGQIVYFQFMEDTFATASTFRVGGSWKIHSDPDGPVFDI
ncbi:nuclear transport factor 2 family protein [Burkholderia cepacia]|uniref:nuclear transport factor 2 family protein n=1 Tax=Burkholderia cepacia TaxID=292 RepID=UPI002AB77F64|nr:nuclear transport factor 2 family protein [Burkholderia cepacia]